MNAFRSLCVSLRPGSSRRAAFQASALVIFLTLGTGCMKEPELKPNFGPEVSSSEFGKLLNQIESPDPYTIKKNEYSYFIRSTVLQDQVYQLDRRWAYTVTNKTEDAQDYIFTYVKELREISGDQEKISQKQEDVRLTKKAPAADVAAFFAPVLRQNTPSVHLRTLQSAVDMGTSLFIPTPSRTVPITTMSTLTPFAYRPMAEGRTTFHNLKLERSNVPVPEFVQQRSNCGGLSEEKCRSALKAFVLSFDQVSWDSEQGQRYSVIWIFSPDVPYFASTMFPSPAGMIKACATTQIPYQGQRVKVTQCDEIKDFTFGTD